MDDVIVCQKIPTTCGRHCPAVKSADGTKRLKRDSSVKMARLYCLSGNRLGAGAIRRNRRA